MATNDALPSGHTVITTIFEKMTACLELLPHVGIKRNLDVMRLGQLPGIKPRTPGLYSQCSATELRQPDNHQPSQSSICTAQVGLKCLRYTPGSLSVCAVKTPLGLDRKILSIGREPKLCGFLSLNA